jgi:phage anti-repressor protein
MATQPLIPVFTGTIQNESVQLVDARALHAFLGVAVRFNDWIGARIKEYYFQENQDFKSFTEIPVKPKKGGRPAIGYHITMDMAKELAMVERNEKGRQIRRYFIECERRAHGAIAYDAMVAQAQAAPAPEPEISAALQAALCREAYQLAADGYDGILAELTERARHYLRTGIPEADILDCLKRKAFGRASPVLPRDLKPLLDRFGELFGALNELVEGGSELYAKRLR